MTTTDNNRKYLCEHNELHACDPLSQKAHNPDTGTQIDRPWFW